MTKGLTLRKLCILRGDAPLIEIDRSIAAGDVLTVMGPSGVG